MTTAALLKRRCRDHPVLLHLTKSQRAKGEACANGVSAGRHVSFAPRVEALSDVQIILYLNFTGDCAEISMSVGEMYSDTFEGIVSVCTGREGMNMGALR